MVDGLYSETLIETGEKGGLSDCVRVSGEAKALVGDSKSGGGISATELKPVEGTNDKNDLDKRRGVAPNNPKWGSRIMNLVGKVLQGKLHMADEEENVDDSKSRSEVNLAADNAAWQNAVREPASENRKVNVVCDNDAWQNSIREPTSENRKVGDEDAWQNEIGEPISENKIDLKRTDNGNCSAMLDSSSPAEGSGLNGNQDLRSHPMVPNVPLKSKKRRFNDMLVPEARGENDITEKKGSYYVSDLVWGKVSCHPWWPGQIFSPLSSSGEAAMNLKKGTYLIAYFGDGTYAWIKESKIKPFGMHFSKMSKQSDSDFFCHAVQCALNETARRVEFGLSCPCLPLEVRDVIKFQEIENTGIMEISSRRAGGHILSGAATFSPGDLLQSLDSLARHPWSKPDRLQFTIEKAQVLAYNRWKGRHELSVYEERWCFLEDDALLNATKEVEGVFPGPVYEVGNGVSSINRESTAIDGSSCKRKNFSGDEEEPELFSRSTKYKKAVQVPEISETDGGEKYTRGAKIVISFGDNHGMVNPLAGKSKGRRGRPPKNLLQISPNGEPRTEKKTPEYIPSPNLVLRKLSLLAKKPMQGHDAMIPLVGWLREFRKSVCPQTLPQANDATNSGNSKAEQPVFEIGDGVLSKKRKSTAEDDSSRKGKSLSGDKNCRKIKKKYLSVLMSSGDSSSLATDKNTVRRGATNTISFGENREMDNPEQPSNFRTADTFGIGGFNDSYWTDRIIHTDSQDQALFKSPRPNESGAQPEADVATGSNVDDNRKKPIVVDLDPEDPSDLVDETSEEYSPTALILRFDNLESIPAIPILNEIFTAFGPLFESETKILPKKNHAKVVFRKKEDAKTAFSSTGKYKTFGIALKSYSLKFVVNLDKTRRTSSEKNKKTDP
ncbi:hypothetical protein ACS0TY_015927 [Phlomoides rotata]